MSNNGLYENVVYIIQAEEGGRIKIGKSQNSYARLQALHTASPSPLRMLRTIPDDDITALEQDLHDRYASYRKHGEWFELPLRELESLLTEDFTKWKERKVYCQGWDDGRGIMTMQLQRMHTYILLGEDNEGNIGPIHHNQCPLPIQDQCCFSAKRNVFCQYWRGSLAPFVDCALVYKQDVK